LSCTNFSHTAMASSYFPAIVRTVPADRLMINDWGSS
jgi:hypothetical protein